jgi:peptide/nickel transport system substrate-binding protein
VSRRQFLTMLGVAGSATLLAACQSAPSPSATTAPAAPAAAKPTEAPKPAASPAAAAPAQPAPAQAAAAQGTPSSARMRIDESSDVSTLNPLAVNSPPTRRRAVQIFAALYAYDAQNTLVPDLADGMPQTPDPRTYVVKLKPNARFHSGRPVTAEDVKFTYDNVVVPDYGSIWRSHVAPALESVTARDATTVEFKLKRPYIPMLAKLAMIPIVSAQQSKDDLAQKPDGAGPFKLVSYQKGNLLELARHEAYHVPGQPNIAAVTVYVVPENATRIANLANGTTQLAPEPSFNDLDLLKSRGLTVNSVPSPAGTYGYINFKRADAPLTNKDLRRALGYATDRATVVSTIWAGQGIPGQTMIRPETWAWDPSYKPWPDTPDLAKAREAAQRSGRAADKIVITTANLDELSSTAVLMQAAAKAAGLNVEVAQIDRAAFIQELQKDDWHLILTDSYTGANSGFEPDYVAVLLGSTGSANFGKYKNDELDKELDAAIFASSREEALPHYRRIQEIDADEVPVLTVAYHNYVEALTANVRNYQTSGLGQYDLRTLEIG